MILAGSPSMGGDFDLMLTQNNTVSAFNHCNPFYYSSRGLAGQRIKFISTKYRKASSAALTEPPRELY